MKFSGEESRNSLRPVARHHEPVRRVFNLIKKISCTGEKHLTIVLQTVRDAYSALEISAVGFLNSDRNPGDSLTKTSLMISYKNRLFEDAEIFKLDFG